MTQTFLQEQACVRLATIRDTAEHLIRMTDRCKSLVEKGLAVDVSGLKAHTVVAQYAELMAMNGTTIRLCADALSTSLREIT